MPKNRTWAKAKAAIDETISVRRTVSDAITSELPISSQ